MNITFTFKVEPQKDKRMKVRAISMKCSLPCVSCSLCEFKKGCSVMWKFVQLLKEKEIGGALRNKREKFKRKVSDEG